MKSDRLWRTYYLFLRNSAALNRLDPLDSKPEVLFTPYRLFYLNALRIDFYKFRVQRDLGDHTGSVSE